MSDKQKHLEMIQGVINRFSTNSFLLKGWNVTLLSALFALSIRNCDFNLVYFAYIPTIILWGLDGFFVWQENMKMTIGAQLPSAILVWLKATVLLQIMVGKPQKKVETRRLNVGSLIR